jgi:hypothetical protein
MTRTQPKSSTRRRRSRRFKPGALRRETPPEAIRWLPRKLDAQRGQALLLPYICATHVMEVLDRACGPEGWQFEIVRESPGSDAWVIGRLTIWTGRGRELRYENPGYPSRVSYDRGEREVVSRSEEPLKSAATDALKRCAVLAGVGRDLREEYGPVSVRATIRTDDGRARLESLDEDPWEVWRRQQACPAGAPKRPLPRQRLLALAKRVWPRATLTSFRRWLADAKRHPGWTYAHETQIEPAARRKVMDALRQRAEEKS